MNKFREFWDGKHNSIERILAKADRGADDQLGLLVLKTAHDSAALGWDAGILEAITLLSKTHPEAAIHLMSQFLTELKTDE